MTSASPPWRQALRAALRERVHRPIVPRPSETSAAVLVLLLEEADGAVNLLLERRADDLSNHAGQFAFPGGATDPVDRSPEETALREAHEEVGITSEDVEILGRLATLRTPTRFVITPVVGAATGPLGLHPSPAEVARILRLPASLLLDPRNFRLVPRRSHGLLIWSTSLVHEGDVIWGATARMLLALRRVLAKVPGPWSQMVARVDRG